MERKPPRVANPPPTLPSDSCSWSPLLVPIAVPVHSHSQLDEMKNFCLATQGLFLLDPSFPRLPFSVLPSTVRSLPPMDVRKKKKIAWLKSHSYSTIPTLFTFAWFFCFKIGVLLKRTLRELISVPHIIT